MPFGFHRKGHASHPDWLFCRDGASLGGQTCFLGGAGPWRVTGIAGVRGATLPHMDAMAVIEPPETPALPCAWLLRGVASNHRYASRAELGVLGMRQPALQRAEATCAALIPIRKSDGWWRMAQNERLALFHAGTGHNRIGLDYLPGIARRLLHCRDLGEPFDFLTWFEFAPAEEPAFDELLRRLRETAEWSFVEREVEIRFTRGPG